VACHPYSLGPEGTVLAENHTHRDELIETIQVSHRQLERYLFYFEKDEDGVFVASERPKFGVDEMLQMGVFEEWSLKDLLCHLIDWEQRFLRWYQAGLEGEMPSDLPSPDLRWDEIKPEDVNVPRYLSALPVEAVLSEMKESYERLVSVVESIPEEALFTIGYYDWTGEACVADYVALCTYRHYDWAKGHIRRWRKKHAGKYLNKRAILERIRTERRRLEQNIERLSDEQMEMVGVVGVWTVKDLLAHLFDWEQRFIGWYEAGLRGETPETPAPGMNWEDLDVLNRRIYEKHRDRTLEDVRQEFDSSYRQVLSVVEGISEEEMFAVGKYAWLGQNNLVGVILANTANHYRWAKECIRDWLKSRGEL
jgi:hypothetical protein